MAAANGWTCAVCGEPAGHDDSNVCNFCDQRFHLAQRQDVPGKDCGEVWINEQFLALEFACRNCLAQHRDEPAPAPRRLRPLAGKRRRYRRRA